MKQNSISRHVVGDETQMPLVDGDSVNPENICDLVDDTGPSCFYSVQAQHCSNVVRAKLVHHHTIPVLKCVSKVGSGGLHNRTYHEHEHAKKQMHTMGTNNWSLFLSLTLSFLDSGFHVCHCCMY